MAKTVPVKLLFMTTKVNSPIFSRASMLMLGFLLTTGIIAFTWSLDVPDIADDWTICLGKYPCNTPQGPVNEGTTDRPRTWIKREWTVRFNSHPFGLIEGENIFGYRVNDPTLCVLPRTISVQTNLQRFTTVRSGLCALIVLFGIAALLAWFIDHEIRRRIQAPSIAFQKNAKV